GRGGPRPPRARRRSHGRRNPGRGRRGRAGMDVVEGLSPTLLATVALVAVVTVAVLTALLLLSRGRTSRSLRRERLRADGAERRLDGILASGRDGVVLHAPSGRVLRVNDAAAAMVAAAPGSLVGTDITSLPVTWVGEGDQQVAPAAVFARRPSHDEHGAP